ncbi:hypothetical protein ACFVOR_25080 [Streptomyces sp. NPDC057837]|uniref:hypothetical protein n=1 Tax=Streptomyces sp. NPDC057837 TaxID=3346260 RepID=UPI003677D957
MVLQYPDRRAFLVLGTGALVGVAQQWAAIEPERVATALDGQHVLAAEASRCIKLVNDAAKQITPHASHPAVRDLQDHIATLA